MQDTVHGLEDKLVSAHDHIIDLEHTNNLSILQANKHKADADKANAILERRTERFEVYRSRKQEEIKRVKAVATQKLAMLQSQHESELNRAEAIQCRREHDHAKALKRAEAELYNLQRKNTKLIVASENKIIALKKAQVKQVSKLVHQVEDAQYKLEESSSANETAVKRAEKNAREKERKHYTKVIESQKKKSDKLSSKVTEMTSRTVSAELQAKRSNAQANRSAQRSDAAMHYTDSLLKRIKELEATVEKQDKHRQQQGTSFGRMGSDA